MVSTLLGSVAAVLFLAHLADADVVARPAERRVLVSHPQILAQRVLNLESQMERLRLRVQELENQEEVYVEPWTCYVETPFDGTFLATRPTKTEAKAMTIAKCMKKTGKSFSCSERKIKCGQ